MTNQETLIGVIDRFEGDWAVIDISDETEPRNIPRNLMPEGAKEGDHLRIEVEGGNIVQVLLDSEATQVIRKRIDEKLARLRRGEHLRGDD